MGEPMNISARNKLHGAIVDVAKGATTAHVCIDAGGGALVKLKKREKAYTIVKATDVMVGLD
jgi:molybdopterin-binding protein